MNQGEQVSIPIEKDSKKDESVKLPENKKAVPKIVKTPKNAFADDRYNELLKKGNLSEKKIKNLIGAFKSVVPEGLKPEEYTKIWKKTFYRGSK